MSETRNVVILGASFAGLSSAHYFLKHTLPQLQKVKDAKYVLHLVDPSTHVWWHIAAPRQIISVKEMPHNKTFLPIMDSFKQYPQYKDSIIFHQGEATAIDTDTRQVAFKPHGDAATESLPYYALIIATGIRSPTPLTTLHGEHTISQKALDEMNSQLAVAKSVVISGGGPVAVETAGEIGSHLKGKGVKIAIINGGDKILPVLGKKFASKAQKQLEKNGVTVLHKTRVDSSEKTADGKTKLQLDNGEVLTTDVYIPAGGVTPNTLFLNDELKQKNGYVNTNGTTTRVDAAGPRVYAVGDVAGIDKGGILNMFKTIPVFGANMSHDLLSAAKTGSVAERTYSRKDAETQLVPVGPKTGVGAFNGMGMPGFMVAMVKGKDYMLKNMDDLVVSGKQWKKA